MNEFFEMEISVNGFQTDILSGILYSEGCRGIYEMDEKKWQVYFDESLAPDKAKKLLVRLKSINPKFNEKSFVISKVPFQDWNREWKKYFKPIEPVAGIWIRPPWDELPANATGMEIIIDPQMAFGTGHHETTSLMIRLMREMSFKGKRVLDVGTGSGILAILAHKFGARSVTAIDDDFDAIANAEHNLQLNQAGIVDLMCHSIHLFEESEYEIVLANIDFEALSTLASKLKSLLKDRGNLIISGILTEETSQIESLYRREGLTLLRKENLREWAAMVWERQL